MIMFWKKLHLVAGCSEPRRGGAELQAHAGGQTAKSRGKAESSLQINHFPSSGLRTGIGLLGLLKRAFFPPFNMHWIICAMHRNVEVKNAYSYDFDSHAQVYLWKPYVYSCLYEMLLLNKYISRSLLQIQ